MTTTRLRNLLFLLCLLSALGAYAEAPRQLVWEELIVRLSAAENPFANLPLEQLEALIDIA